VTAAAESRRADVVVLGAGLAGLTAAVRLAEAGFKVVTVAKGLGSLRLAPATVDILGYAPDRVDNPIAALPGFLAAHPDHPYSLISPEVLAASVSWLKDHVHDFCPYVGEPSANVLLPTALGVLRPSAVVPQTMAGGDARALGSVVIAGLRVLKDFHPAIAAENLCAAGAAAGLAIEARPVMLSTPVNGEADVGALALARQFEDPAFRDKVAAELRGALGGEQAVGVPAVLGLGDVPVVWSRFQDAVGKPVFEIPTIPPSVPGIRLAGYLQDKLRRAGGRLILGAPAVGPELRGRDLVGVRIKTAARQVTRLCRWVVLATGGLASGGIEVDMAGAATETALGVPVHGPASMQAAFLPGYLAEHPMDTIGLRVDAKLRPVRSGGEPVYPNVHAAGAIIGGARPWKEKSGDGISLSTGYLAAQLILEEAR
jgi:glycerol-3-phosphate dehydrogenase subunit B